MDNENISKQAQLSESDSDVLHLKKDQEAEVTSSFLDSLRTDGIPICFEDHYTVTNNHWNMYKPPDSLVVHLVEITKKGKFCHLSGNN